MPDAQKLQVLPHLPGMADDGADSTLSPISESTGSLSSGSQHVAEDRGSMAPFPGMEGLAGMAPASRRESAQEMWRRTAKAVADTTIGPQMAQVADVMYHGHSDSRRMEMNHEQNLNALPWPTELPDFVGMKFMSKDDEKWGHGIETRKQLLSDFEYHPNSEMFPDLLRAKYVV